MGLPLEAGARQCSPSRYNGMAHGVAEHTRISTCPGRLSMGDRVPSEMELAHLFGVSRITSKKALQTLKRDGVIERIIGKGSFVAAQLPALERLSSREAAPRSRRAGPSCIGFVLPTFSPAFEIGLLEGVEARTAAEGVQSDGLPGRARAGKQKEHASKLTPDLSAAALLDDRTESQPRFRMPRAR